MNMLIFIKPILLKIKNRVSYVNKYETGDRLENENFQGTILAT